MTQGSPRGESSRLLLLYGGSFDPPHRAHIELPLRIRRQLGAEAVAYIPAALSPLKSDRKPTPAHHRLAMLSLALAGRDDAVIFTDEIDRAGTGRAGSNHEASPLHRHDVTPDPASHRLDATDPGQMQAEPGAASYTIDTVRALRKRLPRDMQLRLLIGADQVLLFDRWKDADELEQLAEPVVMLRPPWTGDRLWAEAPSWLDRARWEPRLVSTPMLEVSSTQVRQRIAEGKRIDHLVPQPVADYIARHGLYRP